MRLMRVSFSDIRQGADKLHELFDGKIRVPDKVGVVLFGVLGAVIPIAMLMWLYKGDLF